MHHYYFYSVIVLSNRPVNAVWYSMDKPVMFSELCANLGITEDDLYNDGDEDEDDLIETADSLRDPSDNEEEVGVIADDEGDVEVFVERGSDSSDDDEESVNSEEENDQDDNNQFLSPSGISYTSRPIPSRRRRRNVLTETPRAILNPRSEVESFEALISEEILRIILMHTNRKLREIRRSLHVRYPTINFLMEELKAGLALILRAGRDRDNFSDLQGLWQPSDSRPFYRTVMSLNRFKLLLRCLRFDNWHTRDERKRIDKFAAVSEIWNIFLGNARRVYIPGECITVDEQLVGYRGKIPGRTYMPSKPRKYGIKIFWACESNTGYGLNAIAYGGKEGNRVHHNLAQDVVMKLLEPWYGTGRDVCTDNYFTSYSLTQQLLQENLTILGTVRRHRREIPLTLRQKTELYSSQFVFNHSDGICLVAYQAKRNKQPVMLLSSTHTEPSVASDESKKPHLILDYNERKGGVDRFDQSIEAFSCRRKTVRWPLLFFYDMLDAAALNAYVILKKCGYQSDRKEFLTNLTLQLATPAIQARLTKTRTRRSVYEAAAAMGILSPAARGNNSQVFTAPNLPKKCTVCKRNSRRQCSLCKKSVCPQHSVVLKICKCHHCADD